MRWKLLQDEQFVPYWKHQSFEGPGLCRAEAHLPQPPALVAEGRSGTNAIKEEGENLRAEGQSGQDEEDNPRRRRFSKGHVHTPSSRSLAGSASAPKAPLSDPQLQAQNSLAARAEVHCLVDISGCFQQCAAMYIHIIRCWLLTIKMMVTATIGGYKLGIGEPDVPF